MLIMPKRRPEEVEIVDYRDVEETVNEVMGENTDLLMDIQRSIPHAIDKLVAEVMRRTTVKVDPKKIRQMILSKL